MTTFTENFKTLWDSSLGIEDTKHQGKSTVDAAKNTLNRIFEDVVLGNLPETEGVSSPPLVKLGRLIGTVPGTIGALLTTVALLNGPGLATASAGAVIGGVTAHLSKDTEKYPGEISTYVETGRGALAGLALPGMIAYKACAAPFKLSGYAAHAFGTAVTALSETIQDRMYRTDIGAPKPGTTSDFNL